MAEAALKTSSGSGPPVRHFLDLDAIDGAELRGIIEHAKAMKAARAGRAKGAVDADAPFAGEVLALLFEKSSTRTRISFDVAMRQLGGQAIVLDAGTMQLGRGEAIADTASVMSRYVDAVMIRANNHRMLTAFAEHADVPVINGLTDLSHPCQVMADVMTYEEHKGDIAGARFAWLGDGNNVAHSLIHAAAQFGFAMTLACPEGDQPDADIVATATDAGAEIGLTDDPVAAVRGAHCVVTDTWTSMGVDGAEERRARFLPYQVNEALMAHAPDAVFMHCLPAHRGDEVTDGVIDGPQSIILDEAENRLHVQKAILRWCLGA